MRRRRHRNHHHQAITDVIEEVQKTSKSSTRKSEIAEAIGNGVEEAKTTRTSESSLKKREILPMPMLMLLKKQSSRRVHQARVQRRRTEAH